MTDLSKKEGDLGKKNLLIDFFIRWNTTYLMIERLIQFKSIVNTLTSTPENVVGLSRAKIRKLGLLHLDQEDWSNLNLLKKNLEPFYCATKMLSGRKYQTLSISFVVQKVLKSFYSEKVEDNKESILRAAIFDQLSDYIDQSIEKEKKATIVRKIKIFLK